MARLIKNTNNNYVNISNHLVRDDRLSWKARGIFAYLWSQADNWQFYVSEIAKHATDGKDSLAKGLKELEEFGYLKRTPRITLSGKMNGYDWFLSDLSVAVKDGRRETRSPLNRPLSINNNKNYQQQELTTNKKENSAAGTAPLSQLENDFELVWKEYPNKKGKSQAFNHYKAWRKKSVKNTNDYLFEKLSAYKQHLDQNRWKDPMNGSTWFNGRFDDDLAVEDSTIDPWSKHYE